MALLPLQGFVDDSGQGHGAVFVLAGFVATAEAWAAFTLDWKAILEKPIPGNRLKLAYFKTSEAMGLHDQFSGWDPDDRDRCIKRLRATIVKHVPFRICVSVPRYDYNKFIRGKISRAADTPYGAAFNSILLRMAWFQSQRGITAPIDWIFDMHQGKARTAAKRMYWHLKKHGDPWLRALLGGEPLFRSDKEFSPLQAADLLAWHFRMSLRYAYADGPEHEDTTWTSPDDRDDHAPLDGSGASTRTIGTPRYGERAGHRHPIRPPESPAEN